MTVVVTVGRGGSLPGRGAADGDRTTPPGDVTVTSNTPPGRDDAVGRRSSSEGRGGNGDRFGGSLRGRGGEATGGSLFTVLARATSAAGGALF